MKWILVIGAALAIGCSPELQMSDGVSSSAGSGGMGGGAGSGGMGGEGGETSCEPGEHLWSKMFGNMGPQLSTSVAVDAAGHAVTTGYITGTVDFGNGPLTAAGFYDIFINKVDADGNPLWSKRFGDDGDSSVKPQLGTSVAVDSDGNVVVAGQFVSAVDFGGGLLTSQGASNGVLFVAKFDANGNHLWSKRLGGASSAFYIGIGAAVAIDVSGNIVVVGEFGGTIDFGGEGELTSAGHNDIFVAKFDPDGALVWRKGFGDSTGDQEARSVATNAAREIVVTGKFGSTLNFGNYLLTSEGAMDIFVAKLSPAGDPLWGKSFGDVNYDEGMDVVLDASGNVLVAGQFDGTVDFGSGPLTSNGQSNIFAVKLNQYGDTLWSRRFGDADGQTDWGIAADGAGNVLLAGQFGGTLDFGRCLLTSAGSDDAFVAKLDENGDTLWSNRFGDADFQAAWAVAADSLGNVLLTGWAGGTVDFGGGPLTSAGNYNMFLAKVAP